MIKSSDYWKKRKIAEEKWQKQAEKNMQAYNQHIAQMYQNTIDEINRQIKSDLGFAADFFLSIYLFLFPVVRFSFGNDHVLPLVHQTPISRLRPEKHLYHLDKATL